MSVEVAGFKPGILKANADLSAHQFKAVKIGADFAVDLCGAGEQSIGVLQNAPILGEAAEIDMDGISKAVAGAAFAVGVDLMSDATGRLITALATNRVVARSLQAAGAAGELCAVKIIGAAGAVL